MCSGLTIVSPTNPSRRRPPAPSGRVQRSSGRCRGRDSEQRSVFGGPRPDPCRSRPGRVAGHIEAGPVVTVARIRVRLEPQRRVPARARPRAELQREHVLQRLRPGARARGVLPARQPRQRGHGRDDGVPLPARRAGRRSCSSGPRCTTNDAFDAAGHALRRARAVRAARACTTRARSSCSTTRS